MAVSGDIFGCPSLCHVSGGGDGSVSLCVCVRAPLHARILTTGD